MWWHTPAVYPSGCTVRWSSSSPLFLWSLGNTSSCTLEEKGPTPAVQSDATRHRWPKNSNADLLDKNQRHENPNNYWLSWTCDVCRTSSCRQFISPCPWLLLMLKLNIYLNIKNAKACALSVTHIEYRHSSGTVIECMAHLMIPANLHMGVFPDHTISWEKLKKGINK